MLCSKLLVAHVPHPNKRSRTADGTSALVGAHVAYRLCHDVGLRGEVYDPHKYLSPFSSLYSTDVTIEHPFVNIERESGDITRWETEPYFGNPTSWDLMNMMSVQLSSET